MKSSVKHTSSEKCQRVGFIFPMCVTPVFEHLRLESLFRLAFRKFLGTETLLQMWKNWQRTRVSDNPQRVEMLWKVMHFSLLLRVS